MAESVSNVYVVIANGLSDLGKGWLTAAIGRLNLAETLPIKIDPLLNTTFPNHIGVDASSVCSPEALAAFRADYGITGAYHLSDDFRTYADAGLSVYPECNVLAGRIIQEFLSHEPGFVRPGAVKKRTFNDLSLYLAQKLYGITQRHAPRILIIEIGGTVDDAEHEFMPAALRFLGQSGFLGVLPQIVLLTYFDIADSSLSGGYRIKTQQVRKGISLARKVYGGLPLKACFVRRRTVPETIPDDVLIEDLRNVAHETQLDASRLVLVPNVQKNEIAVLTTLVEQSKLF